MGFLSNLFSKNGNGELKNLHRIGNCELYCPSCGETYLIGDNAVITSVSEALSHPGMNEEVQQQLNAMKDFYFVMHADMDEEAIMVSHRTIGKIRNNINKNIETNWICHKCNDLSKLNPFPNYFGLVNSLNKDIMYWPMKKNKLAFVIMKNSFIDSIVQKSGSEKAKDAVIPMLGMMAMENILGEMPATFDKLLDKDDSKVMEYFKGYEVKEFPSCNELLQAYLPSWDVPVSVMTFFYN